MIVWLWFAKEADFDERTRQVWLDRICSGSGCTQQRLLECLEGCLQYCGTAHKRWSSDAFSQLGCTKSGAAGVFVTDRMVQHLLRGHPTSCEEWKVSVVRGWFGNEEQPSAFLLRANAFLRQHLIDGTQVLEAVVKTRSFVSFIFATRLASLLLFAYLEARKLSAATDAAAGATANESVFGGFSAFVSSDKLVFRTSEARHPCRVALPLVCQGLRCLAQVPPRLREMLGPTQAMFALEADRQAVQVHQAELLATGSKKLNKGDRADDEVESPAAEKRTPESTAAERKVLREYLRSMLARTEAVRDSASGEEHKICEQCVNLKLLPFAAISEQCEVEDEDNDVEDLLCPITHGLMDDPVILSVKGENKCDFTYEAKFPNKSTYERAAIERWIQHNTLSPKIKAKLEGCTLTENVKMKQQIAELKRKMRNKEIERRKKVEGEEERRVLARRKGYAPIASASGKEQDVITSDQLSATTLDTTALCIVGAPASGKTTLMLGFANRKARRALEALDKMDDDARLSRSAQPIDQVLIPLFIPAVEIVSLLAREAAAVGGDFTDVYIARSKNVPEQARDLLRRCLRQGRTVLIVDGLDEAAGYRLYMETSLDGLARRGTQQLVVSTRELSFEDSCNQGRLQAFKRMVVQPLTDALVRKVVEARIGDLKAQDAFLEQLKVVATSAAEFKENPYMLCLAIAVFKQRGEIPTRGRELYRLSVENCCSRSVSRASESELSLSGGLGWEPTKVVSLCEHFLGCLAYVCHVAMKQQDFVFDSGLRRRVQERWETVCGFEESQFSQCERILFGSPLVGVLTCIADGAAKEYRFSHLTQQEYLAGVHVLQSLRPESAASQLYGILELDAWTREVYMFAASSLNQHDFHNFCALLLEHEDGTFALCELVKELMRERGRSESTGVMKMLAQKYVKFRSVDEMVIAFCHPSTDFRDRALTELKAFAPKMTADVIEGLIRVVKHQSVPAHTWFEKCAAILSVSLLCDKTQSTTTVSSAVKFVLSCLASNTMRHVSTRALGTVIRTATSQADPDSSNAYLAAIKAQFLEASTDMDLLAGALTEMKLTPKQLVCIFAESQYQTPVLTAHVLSYIEAISRSETEDSESENSNAERAFLQLVRNLLAEGWFEQRERSLQAAVKLLEKCKTSKDVPEVSLLLDGTRKLLSHECDADFQTEFRDLSMLALQFRLHELENPLEACDALKMPETTPSFVPRPEEPGWTCGCCRGQGAQGKAAKGRTGVIQGDTLGTCQRGVHSMYSWPGWSALYQANPHLMTLHQCCLCSVKRSQGAEQSTGEGKEKKRNREHSISVCSRCAKTRTERILQSVNSRASRSLHTSSSTWLEQGSGAPDTISKEWWRTRLQDLLHSCVADVKTHCPPPSASKAQVGKPDPCQLVPSSISREELLRWDEDIVNADVSTASFPSRQLYQLAFEHTALEDLAFECEHNESNERGCWSISQLHSFLDLRFADETSQPRGGAKAKVLEKNSEEWASILVEALQLRGVGRFLFSPVLEHVEKTVREDPERSVEQLRPLKEALQAAARTRPASDLAISGKRHLGLEVQMLLKELHVGPRNEAPALWHGPLHIKWGGSERAGGRAGEQASGRKTGEEGDAGSRWSEGLEGGREARQGGGSDTQIRSACGASAGAAHRLGGLGGCAGEDEFEFYSQVEAHMSAALQRYEEEGGQRSLHELLDQMDPPPDIMVSQALLGIADDITSSDAPTR